MDENRVKGKAKDIKGRVERQTGEWTDDKDLQSEGTADQAKGKAQNAWGKVKDAVRDVRDDLRDKDREKKDEAA
jgi:uncharacterized protein YjbJ (UPF0337 family)